MNIRQKTLFIIGHLDYILFVFIALGLLVLVFFEYEKERYEREQMTLMGTVISIVTNDEIDGFKIPKYSISAEYTHDDGSKEKIYSGDKWGYTSHQVNDEIPVYYNKYSNPSSKKQLTLNRLWPINSLGIIYLSIALIFLIQPLRLILTKRKERNLMEFEGHRIRCDQVNVEFREFPDRFIICAEGLLLGKKAIFHSDPIAFDPSFFIKERAISVSVHPNDPTKYLMDLHFLPKAGR